MKPLTFICALFFLGAAAFPKSCFGTHSGTSKSPAAIIADFGCDNYRCEEAIVRFIDDLTRNTLTWNSLRNTVATDGFTHSNLYGAGTYAADGRVRETPVIVFQINVTALQPPGVGSGLIQAVRLGVPTPDTGAMCIQMNELIRSLGWDTSPQPPIPLHNGGSQYSRIGVVNGTEVRIGSYGHHYPCVDTIALFQMTRADPVDRQVPPF